MRGTLNLLAIFLGIPVSLTSMGFTLYIFLQLLLTGRSYWRVDPAVPYEFGTVILGMAFSCILFYRIFLDWIDATVKARTGGR